MSDIKTINDLPIEIFNKIAEHVGYNLKPISDASHKYNKYIAEFAKFNLQRLGFSINKDFTLDQILHIYTIVYTFYEDDIKKNPNINLKSLYTDNTLLPELYIKSIIIINDIYPIMFLLENYPKINVCAWTMLNMVKKRRIPMIKVLIGRCSELSLQQLANSAAQLGYLDIVKILEEKLTRFDDDILVYATKSGNFEMFKYILDKGFLISPTILYISIESNNINIVKHILNIWKYNGDHPSYLSTALEKNYEIARFLISYGFPVRDIHIEIIIRKLYSTLILELLTLDKLIIDSKVFALKMAINEYTISLIDNANTINQNISANAYLSMADAIINTGNIDTKYLDNEELGYMNAYWKDERQLLLNTLGITAGDSIQTITKHRDFNIIESCSIM